MLHVKNIGIISSACMSNSRRGRLLFEQSERDSKKKRGAVYTALDSKSLSPVTILGDKIPWKSFNSEVMCHQIKLGLNSALIFTVTATSEGLFALLETCLCLLAMIIIVLHLFLAQYFEPSIVYICSFLVESHFGRAKSIAK